MMIKTLAVAALLSVTLAAPALAGPSSGLAIGGNTIAGPGTATIAADTGATVYLNPAADTDLCTTVANSGRASVRLTLTGDGTGSVDVAPGKSAALCRNDVTEIDIDCLSLENSCTAQWRADRD